MTDQDLRTPLTSIYIKTDEAMSIPEDEECYYLLTRSGLFIGRNTPLMRSLAPARQCPAELAAQKPFLTMRCPRVPAGLVATIESFFKTIAYSHGAEAGVLLVLDETRNEIRPLVPRQRSSVGIGYSGRPYPIRLQYDTPPMAHTRLRIIGDVHSHVFDAAYASSVDVYDEDHRAGLHLVAGRLDRDPTEWHAEYVVDGTRFPLAPESVMELDAHPVAPPRVPRRWLRRVRIERWDSYSSGYGSGTTANGKGGYR
jgi:hypothetical protein